MKLDCEEIPNGLLVTVSYVTQKTSTANEGLNVGINVGLNGINNRLSGKSDEENVGINVGINEENEGINGEYVGVNGENEENVGLNVGLNGLNDRLSGESDEENVGINGGLNDESEEINGEYVGVTEENEENEGLNGEYVGINVGLNGLNNRLSGELNEENVGINVGINEENEGINLLLALIDQNPNQKIPFFASKLNVTERTVERWVRELRDNGKILYKGPKRTGGYWKVNENEEINLLLTLIEQNPNQKIPFFASKLNVTERTVERWVRELRDNGKVIYKGSNKRGGYYRKRTDES
jgi:predicted transcriptional regulator